MPNRLVNILTYKRWKGKAIPLQAWTGPERSRRLSLPDFIKVVRSVLSTGRLYPQKIFLALIFVGAPGGAVG